MLVKIDQISSLCTHFCVFLTSGEISVAGAKVYSVEEVVLLFLVFICFISFFLYGDVSDARDSLNCPKREAIMRPWAEMGSQTAAQPSVLCPYD